MVIHGSWFFFYLIWNTPNTRWLYYEIQVVATFLVIFGAQYQKWWFLAFIEWPIRCPRLCSSSNGDHYLSTQSNLVWTHASLVSIIGATKKPHVTQIHCSYQMGMSTLGFGFQNLTFEIPSNGSYFWVQDHTHWAWNQFLKRIFLLGSRSHPLSLESISQTRRNIFFQLTPRKIC